MRTQHKISLTRRAALQGLGTTLIIAPSELVAAAGPKVGPPRIGFNCTSWDKEVNQDPEHWVEAIADLASLGIQNVTLVPYWFVDRRTGEVRETSRRAHDAGPSGDVLAQSIRAARGLGMTVSLKPLIEIDSAGELGGTWRGSLGFQRAKLDRFFESYGAFILLMAGIARANGADRFYVGSELARLSALPSAASHWEVLIERIRLVYPAGMGILSYAANFDELETVPFWRSLDEIGVDAYFPLAEEEDAVGPGRPATADMVRVWRQHFDLLKALSSTLAKPIYFSEFGLIPYDLASSEPWNWYSRTQDRVQLVDRSYDPDEQFNGIDALLQAIRPGDDWLTGIDFWHWKVPGSEGSEYAISKGSTVADLIGRFARNPAL